MSPRLRSIALRGFKSFGEPARLALSPGINAVVGPNGSGKSNVVEALRWASHTARARELRTRTATELIFHGSKGKPPLGFAEVEFELEGVAGAGRLAVSRRLYKDGEGELELGGRPVLVRELYEVLRGSGLGPGGLAVVGQGEVGAVVSADPGAMLGYLEEAAGLSRSTHRRAQTAERLTAVRAHLERAEERAGELRARVERLAFEAQAAARRTVLEAEREVLEGALHRARLGSARAELARLAGELAEAEASAERERAALESATVGLTTARLAREDAQAEHARRAAETERLLGHARTAAERAGAARRDFDSASRERAALEREAGSLAQPPVLPELGPPPRDDLGALAAGLAAACARLREAEFLEAEARADLLAARRRREAQEREAAAAESRQAARGAERATLELEFAETVEALAVAQGGHSVALADFEARRPEVEASRARLAETDRDLTASSGRLSVAATRLAEIRAAAGPLRREGERLHAALAAHARFGEGPRRALSSGEAGVLGAVADLVAVPAEFEAAVGAALGRRLEHVVVETGDVAQRVIEHLKRVGGRATFLPLDLLQLRSRRRTELLGEPGVLGVAADLIEARIPRVAEVLLGDTVVVQTVDLAVRLAHRHKERPRLVTLEGELLEPGGAVTGGRGRNEGAGHLADARRLAELQAELEGLEDEGRHLEAASSGERARAAELTGARGALQAAFDAARRALDAARSNVASFETRLEGLADRRARLAARLSALGQGEAQEVSPAPVVLEPLEAAAAGAGARLAEARRLEHDTETALREAETRLALHAERRRTRDQAEARRDQAEARRSAVAARLAELGPAAADAQGRLVAAEREAALRNNEARALDLPGALASLTAAEARRREAEAELTARTAGLSAARERLEALRLARARREAALEVLLAAAPLDTPDPDPPGSPRGWAAQLAAVGAELERIGPVNLLAREAYGEEAARLRELEVGVADARASVDELAPTLAALETEVGARRREAVARVNAAYGAYVAELLGGEGELEPVFDPAGALTGLALGVRPGGKRTRSLHLLSTGERTMAALAFLFALSHAPESGAGLPLAVLDEVDAPLDEANIRRFTRFLRLLADRGTQFVLVTHQKATMEIADALCGVTSDEGGLSRTFSIRQEQATD